MKIIVTHTSPDWDAIGSVWILKKFLPGWQEAAVEFVPAGTKSKRRQMLGDEIHDVIEKMDNDEIIHVDTGMGPLDHHQTADDTVCGTTRCWDYVQKHLASSAHESFTEEHKEAVQRVVNQIVEDDHFKEIFRPDAASDYQDFSLIALLDGLKLFKPNQDDYYVEFGRTCLDAVMHNYLNKIWAEREIANNGIIFQNSFGKCIAFETLNDDVLKLSQKMGYQIAIRRDPRKGYVRIKARPTGENEKGIDLTKMYEILKEKDPHATWFLHVSKKMLLNGTAKNPAMKPTTLRLQEIISVAETL